MGFKSVQEITGISSVRQRSDALLSMSTDKNGGSASGFTLRLSMSDKLMQDARILRGDKVEVLFDIENRQGLIRRVTTGGWKVSGTPTKTTNGRGIVQLTWVQGLPSVEATSPCGRVKVTDMGIIFDLPESASTGALARSAK